MPVGQTIVKESWQPVEVQDNEKVPAIGPGTKFDFAFNSADGKPYRPGKQASLFIMVKTDPKTPGTDQGWVYGTVTRDGKRVTSAGRVQSCMGCHQSAPRDRMFGLPRTGGGGVRHER